MENNANTYRPRVPTIHKPSLDATINQIGWDGIMQRIESTAHAMLAEPPLIKAEGYEKWIILPDVHRPFHNKVLWHKIMKLISEIEIDGLIFSGDYLDLFTLGSYNADSLELLRDITLDDEYKDGRVGLADVEKALKGRKVKKVFIYGNHEDRYLREIKKKDNGKFGGALLSPREALRLDDLDYKVLERWQDDSYELGNHLEVCHGIFTNIHPAKKHMEEFQCSVIFGHTHRISSHGAGKHIGYNIGWLGDAKNPVFSYMYKKARINKWMNGFAFVNLDENGYFWTEQIQCYNDKFFYSGKLY